MLGAFIWNPATSYSPGRSAMALLRPLGAAMASPSQVRCMHVDWDGLIIESARLDMKKPQQKLASAIIAPGRSQPRCIRHRRRAAVNLAKYDACTLTGNNPKKYIII